MTRNPYEEFIWIERKWIEGFSSAYFYFNPLLQGHFQTDSKSQKPDRGKPAGLSLVT